jgi:hypothetical protein
MSWVIGGLVLDTVASLLGAVFCLMACRCRNIKIHKKVKFTLKQAVKAQKGSRGITVLSL